MNTPATPQRRWRAACPNCGAPVEFASAASPVAVCSYCRSTLAREGEALRRIGESAELFDDHSPLQVGTTGRWQGEAFVVAGRLQMAYAQGRWNEWHVVFDNGRSAWLSEDNGRYVLGFALPLPAPLPEASALVPGAALTIDARQWRVASVVHARVEAAQGELPFAPPLHEPVQVIELRSSDDEVAALEFTGGAPSAWTVGQPVALAALALAGLREDVDDTVAARSADCPACGAPLQIRLQSTRSIACAQCHAVVDVSQGVGGELAHYAQREDDEAHGRPQIPLGATGRLDLGEGEQRWQVVGYVVRRTTPADAEDETFTWREYVLYCREVGFAFLVDAEDGWSSVVPLAGAPAADGAVARWKGLTYRKLESYESRVVWVLGELYWRLSRGERCRHVDYGAGQARLNMEAVDGEVTWSQGRALDSDTVARAFALPDEVLGALRRDATPFKADDGASPLAGRVIVGIVLVVVMLIVLAVLSGDECDEVRATFGAQSAEARECEQRGRYAHRTSGGSFGGSGGGGGHK